MTTTTLHPLAARYLPARHLGAESQICKLLLNPRTLVWVCGRLQSIQQLLNPLNVGGIIIQSWRCFARICHHPCIPRLA